MMKDWREYLTSDSDTYDGALYVRGTNLAVSIVLKRLAQGETQAQLLEAEPSLTKQALAAVLLWASETAGREGSVKSLSQPNEIREESSAYDSDAGASWSIPGPPSPSREPEFKWLRQPPERYRGQWVALVGSEVVAAGETLQEMLDAMPEDSPRRPLAVQIV